MSFLLYWFFHHSIIVVCLHLILYKVNFSLFLWPYHLRWFPLIYWIFKILTHIFCLTFFLKVNSWILIDAISTSNLLRPDLPLILIPSKYVPKQLGSPVLDLIHNACLWVLHLTLLSSRIVSGVLTQHSYHHWCVVAVLVHHWGHSSPSEWLP